MLMALLRLKKHIKWRKNVLSISLSAVQDRKEDCLSVVQDSKGTDSALSKTSRRLYKLCPRQQEDRLSAVQDSKRIVSALSKTVTELFQCCLRLRDLLSVVKYIKGIAIASALSKTSKGFLSLVQDNNGNV